MSEALKWVQASFMSNNPYQSEIHQIKKGNRRLPFALCLYWCSKKIFLLKAHSRRFLVFVRTVLPMDNHQQ